MADFPDIDVAEEMRKNQIRREGTLNQWLANRGFDQQYAPDPLADPAVYAKAQASWQSRAKPTGKGHITFEDESEQASKSFFRGGRSGASSISFPDVSSIEKIDLPKRPGVRDWPEASGIPYDPMNYKDFKKNFEMSTSYQLTKKRKERAKAKKRSKKAKKMIESGLAKAKKKKYEEGYEKRRIRAMKKINDKSKAKEKELGNIQSSIKNLFKTTKGPRGPRGPRKAKKPKLTEHEKAENKALTKMRNLFKEPKSRTPRAPRATPRKDRVPRAPKKTIGCREEDKVKVKGYTTKSGKEVRGYSRCPGLKDPEVKVNYKLAV